MSLGMISIWPSMYQRTFPSAWSKNTSEGKQGFTFGQMHKFFSRHMRRILKSFLLSMPIYCPMPNTITERLPVTGCSRFKYRTRYGDVRINWNLSRLEGYPIVQYANYSRRDGLLLHHPSTSERLRSAIGAILNPVTCTSTLKQESKLVPH
jgi:hypothetical protein